MLKNYKIISISGMSGSGKTTLANIFKQLVNKKVSILSVDNYYKNINKENFENYDHPNAFNIKLLNEDIKLFLKTKKVIHRKYSFITKESNIISIEKNVDILIIEGIYTYYFDFINKISNIKIFLDFDVNLCIERRIKRDKLERGISEEENYKMINEFVLDMYYKYIIKQKNKADVIIKNTKEIEDIIYDIKKSL